MIQRGGTTFPWLRGFKIADNQSPVPQDRVFFSFNYYYNLNHAVNQRLGVPVQGIQAYRYLLGFEKTFFDGLISIGVRDGINTLSVRSPNQTIGGTHSSVGDLNIFGKFVALRFGDFAPQATAAAASGLGGARTVIESPDPAKSRDRDVMAWEFSITVVCEKDY